MPINVVVEGIDALDKSAAVAAAARNYLRTGIGKAVRDFSMSAEAIAKDYASGPRSSSRLGVVSGRLHSSITSEVTQDGDDFEAKVGTNVEYAAMWEFGFHGTQQVDAHTRVVTQVFGRPVKGGSLIEKVRGFSRKVDNDARPFLKPAIDDALPQLEVDVGQVMESLDLGGE